jgi:hypothetical protein
MLNDLRRLSRVLLVAIALAAGHVPHGIANE